MNFQTAKTVLKSTFYSAFTKSKGTKQHRVSIALTCLRRVPCSDSVALNLWAVNYCENWKTVHATKR